jgi:hypothetical protein
LIEVADKPRGSTERARSKFLTRYVLPSDNHSFVGRICDLSIVALRFNSYEEISQYPDCKYAIDVNYDLCRLVQRVESLNMAGELIWMDPIPQTFKGFPVSRYHWLTIAADVFLLRYISVVDCAIIVTNTIFQAGLDVRKCSIDNLRRKNVSKNIIDILKTMIDDQGALRTERNSRFHHGVERSFTNDDATFKIAAQFEHRANGMTGTDRFGRSIDVEQSFREGLVKLQQEFNNSARRLIRCLSRLYSNLQPEFEHRFGPLIRNASHGFNAR